MRMLLQSLALCLVATGSLTAQQVARQIDTTEVMVLSRALDSVRADREDVGRFRGEADARYSINRARIAEEETQIEILEKEIETVNQRVKAAKKDKREADKTEAEFAKKDLERRKNLAERRRDLRRAEADRAQAEMEYADATIRALDFEQQLNRRRLDGADRQLLTEFERKTLEAKLEQEYRRRGVADRRAQVIQRQLSLMDAQQAFVKR